MSTATQLFSQAWFILLIATVLIICCCWCNCMAPCGRCAQRAFDLPCLRCGKWCRNPCTGWETTTRGTTGDGRKSAGANDVRENNWSCFEAVPFLITCGFCCGMLKETSSHDLPLRTNLPVAQPMAGGDAKETTGAEAVIAVSMPLLGL